ncbi:3-isopropylmalate dehydratase small subunit [Candidatus Blochmanniella vafra str. BVAF]|uniref:3-isopropylmalate dehydratase small subunit n=1 Tax=Blochmanniella vafra (strain BVAF) TaxID=859654 RepID=E8Q5P1_BLOVB|nr:3-isopropylmalate dehydratase small subunit [Candidatus Blochmannia vafer]ADV33538.1 3-isopropylmalate dehydratase small subunit [Candidatus Blochmannia vafer str. BVAF]
MNKTTSFNQHTGIVLPLDIANVDTDCIIPKQFLQKTTRDNFGKYLFFNWRFLENAPNSLNYNFILNNFNYKDANILLTRKNFGCGSSREHAVWALIDYGFRVIIAPSFSDIFYENSFNNRLLLTILSELEVNSLFEEINTCKNKVMNITVNLYNQTIHTKNNKYLFQINDFYKNFMINNLDKISLTLLNNSMIQEYEDNQPSFLK